MEKVINKNPFTPVFPLEYPEGNIPDFETYFLNRYAGEIEDREYLPILWTAYQIIANYGKERRAMQELQRYVDSLDKTKKYFTIVQYDDGILANIRRLDIVVFAMSGPRVDYPLPLLCQPHPYKFEHVRSIRINYMGRNTHPIRRRINMLKGKQGVFIPNKPVSTKDYCSFLSRSVFTLCPRGYGVTSFRIAEAMQYGSIPVYISNSFIFPHRVKFEEYGYVIKEHEINKMYRMLMSIPDEEIAEKQKAVEKFYSELYTFEANYDLIINYLKQQA